MTNGQWKLNDRSFKDRENILEETFKFFFFNTLYLLFLL
jgi:hypothetical protein